MYTRSIVYSFGCETVPAWQSKYAKPESALTQVESDERLCIAAAAAAGVQKGTYLVEIEHQVQLTHVAEVVIQDLYKQVDGLQRHQLVVNGVNAHGEEQASIPPVHHLVGLELCGRSGD